MKKILITGQNSYIGTNVEKTLKNSHETYIIDTIDLKDGTWIDYDFHDYDVVFHVAGIVHVKELKKNYELYNQVNRDLTIEVAKRAKAAGVKQFIFLSTMSVYGVEKGVIRLDTKPKPKTAYGSSKLDAEKGLQLLDDEDFKVVILRPPMVYGNQCPGNYAKLVKLALVLPLYPHINNKRSMIYVEHLARYIKHIIDHDLQGLFFPQNREYVETMTLIKEIRKAHNKKTRSLKIFNWIIYLTKNIFRQLDKVYGTLIYDIKANIQIEELEFKETIIRSESKIT